MILEACSPDGFENTQTSLKHTENMFGFTKCSKLENCRTAKVTHFRFSLNLTLENLYCGYKMSQFRMNKIQNVVGLVIIGKGGVIISAKLSDIRQL